MSSYNVTSKIHAWIGRTSKSEDEFYRYFSINPVDRDAGVGASQFDKDVHMEWYDDDLIGIYFNEATNDLTAAIDEIPTSPGAIDTIRTRCIELGITEANAMFYYKDAELKIADEVKKYNDLTYLGSFDNS